MKVRDLLTMLADVDPEANVLLGTQPGYPMEYALRGVAVRSDFSGAEDTGAGARPNDVLLLEGAHLRYGTRDAWDQARTA